MISNIKFYRTTHNQGLQDNYVELRQEIQENYQFLSKNAKKLLKCLEQRGTTLSLCDILNKTDMKTHKVIDALGCLLRYDMMKCIYNYE